MGEKIPINEAKKLAQKYSYEQIIILSLKKHPTKNEYFDGWRTTYNKDKSKCKFLGKVAKILSYNFRAFYSNEKITKEYCNKIDGLEVNNGN